MSKIVQPAEEEGGEKEADRQRKTGFGCETFQFENDKLVDGSLSD